MASVLDSSAALNVGNGNGVAGRNHGQEDARQRNTMYPSSAERRSSKSMGQGQYLKPRASSGPRREVSQPITMLRGMVRPREQRCSEKGGRKGAHQRSKTAREKVAEALRPLTACHWHRANQGTNAMPQLPVTFACSFLEFGRWTVGSWHAGQRETRRT